MSSWRVWHSAKSFCKFIVDNTILSKEDIEYRSLPESDAAKSSEFTKVPDHIKKILYLDAPDVIIEYNQEPIICIEETKEAGTGHNVFQRFARIAAAAENGVPAIYIMPEAKIISRMDYKDKWDKINPIIFKAFENVMRIFDIPALVFYYPTDYEDCPDDPQKSNHKSTKGLIYSDITKYPACPQINGEMEKMFEVLNTILGAAMRNEPLNSVINATAISQRRDWMLQQFAAKLNGKSYESLSPLSATVKVPTEWLVNYLSEKYLGEEQAHLSDLLESRKDTIIYQCDAAFRGDPYAGSLAAIDYLSCRKGKSYEDRNFNLVLCFGKVTTDSAGKISVKSSKSSIEDFISAVRQCNKKNLLTTQSYDELSPTDIGRYYMQVRYGSMYSKVKHIRVFSYFADAVLFEDGALWREA